MTNFGLSSGMILTRSRRTVLHCLAHGNEMLGMDAL